MSHKLSSKTGTYHFMPELEPQPCLESNFSHSSKDHEGDTCLSMKVQADSPMFINYPLTKSTTLFVSSSTMTLSNVPTLWEPGEIEWSQSLKHYIRSALYEGGNLGIQMPFITYPHQPGYLSFPVALCGPHLLKLSLRLLPLTSSFAFERRWGHAPPGSLCVAGARLGFSPAHGA